MTINVARMERWVLTLAVALPVLLGDGAAVGSNEAALQPGETFRDCTDCPEMVVIPRGSFQMGASSDEITRDVEAVAPGDERVYAQKSMSHERPQHLVDMARSFAIGKYLVTRGEFAAFVKDTGCAAEGGCYLYANLSYPLRPEASWRSPGFSQTDRDPVVCVSWQDAKAYVAWLNGKLHDRTTFDGDDPYHLPSEAEWEYAARAGTRTARWWGDPIGSGNADCDGCGSRWDNQRPAPAGSFGANAFGLSDVLGSAWEWTDDCWNESFAGAPQDGSAWRTGRCELRVMRGGNWHNRPWVLRSSHRSRDKLRDRTNYIGFRVAKTLPGH